METNGPSSILDFPYIYYKAEDESPMSRLIWYKQNEKERKADTGLGERRDMDGHEEKEGKIKATLETIHRKKGNRIILISDAGDGWII